MSYDVYHPSHANSNLPCLAYSLNYFSYDCVYVQASRDYSGINIIQNKLNTHQILTGAKKSPFLGLVLHLTPSVPFVSNWLTNKTIHLSKIYLVIKVQINQIQHKLFCVCGKVCEIALMAVAWRIISQEWEKFRNALHSTPGINYPNHQDFLFEDIK